MTSTSLASSNCQHSPRIAYPASGRLRRQLGILWAQADREQELAVILHDTAEREREVVMQINDQLLTQIKALQKAQQRVIELSAREAQVNTSSEIHQHSQLRPTYI